jgi:hypothetical protein
MACSQHVSWSLDAPAGRRRPPTDWAKLQHLPLVWVRRMRHVWWCLACVGSAGRTAVAWAVDRPGAGCCPAGPRGEAQRDRSRLDGCMVAGTCVRMMGGRCVSGGNLLGEGNRSGSSAWRRHLSSGLQAPCLPILPSSRTTVRSPPERFPHLIVRLLQQVSWQMTLPRPLRQPKRRCRPSREMRSARTGVRLLPSTRITSGNDSLSSVPPAAQQEVYGERISIRRTPLSARRRYMPAALRSAMEETLRSRSAKVHRAIRVVLDTASRHPTLDLGKRVSGS